MAVVDCSCRDGTQRTVLPRKGSTHSAVPGMRPGLGIHPVNSYKVLINLEYIKVDLNDIDNISKQRR